MPKKTKTLSLNAQAQRYADRKAGDHQDANYENNLVRKAWLAGYAAARRDPMVINGITEPARWAECARWCDAIQAVCPNKNCAGDFGGPNGIANYIAASFNVDPPHVPVSEAQRVAEENAESDAEHNATSISTGNKP